MGMDGVFVCMAQEYYCPANNSKAFWIDSTKLVDLCEKADKTFPLLIGKKAPRLILADTSETKWIDFYNLPNKYNLLLFWDPDCGHCKKEIPKLTKKILILNLLPLERILKIKNGEIMLNLII
jgi:hypothetical protein